jgi:hypothetical protein
VVECLVRTPSIDAAVGQSIDLVGPDALTYGEMLAGIAAELGIERPGVNLPIFTSPTFAAVASRIAGADTDLVRALMGSLDSDVLPRSASAARDMRDLFGVEPLRFVRAVRRALADWERDEPLAAR